MRFYVLILLLILDFAVSERCPLFFGEFECPKDYNCVFGTCKNSKDETPPANCSKVDCGIDARCFDGKCIPFEGLPCDRNVLIAENTARSIKSDCGWRGKCINGKCAIDKCFEKLCNDDEICRDGNCAKIVGAFCWSNFDCGKQRRCQANRCIDDPSAILCGMEKCPKGTICTENVCVADPCFEKGCPLDHSCLLGECRLTQGMICQENCPEPFLCHNGLCVKNECRRKVCQIGERCENGLCIRIDGKLCSMGIRDCGEAFQCHNGQCKDTIEPANATNIAV